MYGALRFPAISPSEIHDSSIIIYKRRVPLDAANSGCAVWHER